MLSVPVVWPARTVKFTVVGRPVANPTFDAAHDVMEDVIAGDTGYCTNVKLTA